MPDINLPEAQTSDGRNKPILNSLNQLLCKIFHYSKTSKMSHDCWSKKKQQKKNKPFTNQ